MSYYTMRHTVNDPLRQGLICQNHFQGWRY